MVVRELNETRYSAKYKNRKGGGEVTGPEQSPRQAEVLLVGGRRTSKQR